MLEQGAGGQHASGVGTAARPAPAPIW